MWQKYFAMRVIWTKSFHTIFRVLNCCPVIIVSAVLLFAVSCDKKKDDASTDNGYTGVAAVALTNIDSVQNSMAPDAMLTTQTASTVMTPLHFSTQLMAEDFCAGNFFSCQPKLVKLYIAISRLMLPL